MNLKDLLRDVLDIDKDFFEKTDKPENNRTPLTEPELHLVLNDNPDGCVFYNIIQNKPVSRKYNSQIVVGIQQIKNHIPLFHERYNTYCPNVSWQPIAFVAKVSDAKSVKQPMYHPLGRHIFGNIIMHNTTTQNYSLLIPQWSHVVPFRCAASASEEALYQTFLHFLHNPTLIAEYVKKMR